MPERVRRRDRLHISPKRPNPVLAEFGDEREWGHDHDFVRLLSFETRDNIVSIAETIRVHDEFGLRPKPL